MDEKFLTTQHERDVETGLDYRGARFYDSDVARFLSLDPLASDYPSLSDYSYVGGNPILFIEPTGMAVEIIFVDEAGNTILETDDGSDQVYVIAGEYKDSFIEVMDLVIGKSESDNAEVNSLLGEVFGYKIEDIFENRYPAFDENTDWTMGYRCGYSQGGEVGACAGVTALQAEGKGGGIASNGKGAGTGDFEQGLMNVDEPEIKGNDAQYSIENREKTIRIMGDKITIKFQVLNKNFDSSHSYQ